MKTQAVAFTAPLRAALLTVDLPDELPPDGVLIDVHRTLISAGTERNFLSSAPFYPFFPGYSVAGVVARVGSAVRRFRAGQRVFAVAGHAAQVVCNEAGVVAIPDDVDFESASFGTVATMAMYATRCAEIRLGEPVAILGQGLIGLIALQLARVSGALPLIGVDIDAGRLALSRRLGADECFDAREPAALKSAVAALAGGGVDAVIEFTAAPSAVDLAVDITRPRGRIFLGSLGRGADGRADPYGPMWLKGITLIGGYINARPHALHETLMLMEGWPPKARAGGAHFGAGSWTAEADTLAFFELLRHGRVAVQPLVSHRVAPAEAPALFASLGAGDTGMLGAVFRWRD